MVSVKDRSAERSSYQRAIALLLNVLCMSVLKTDVARHIRVSDLFLQWVLTVIQSSSWKLYDCRLAVGQATCIFTFKLGGTVRLSDSIMQSL